MKGKLFGFFGIRSNRTKNITIHVFSSLFYKLGSVATSLLLIPLTMDCISTEDYGIWLIISTFLSWFTLVDGGLGNGLRNKFGEAKAIGDFALAKAYVSTSYISTSVLLLFVSAVFFVFSDVINWTALFNCSTQLSKDLSLLVPVTIAFFSMQMVLKLVLSVYAGDQVHSMPSKVNFIVQFFSLISVWVMKEKAINSLFVFVMIISILPVIVLLAVNLIAFKKRFFQYKPSLNSFNFKHLKSVFGIGIGFFFVQIAWMIMSATDGFIIAQLYGPSAVVPFNTAIKYYSVVFILFTVIVTPYWSSFTESYHALDFIWIRKSMKVLDRFVIVFVMTLLVFWFISTWVFDLWLPKEIVIDAELNFVCCVYNMILIALMPYNYFINGVGKIRVQLIQTIVMSLINIPLSILLAKFFNLGVEGIVLGSILSMTPGIVLSRIQFNKLINHSASGVWLK